MGPLDTLHPALLAALTVLPTTAALLRAWLRHRTAVHLEREHTLRVRLAVEGSDTKDRAEVVRACARLEAASRGTAPQGPASRGPASRGPASRAAPAPRRRLPGVRGP
ncbi:hypothetical protein [Streptomyces daliensis]|uniref:Uncharacterized protein n=1 Tax=Streptomyces daliensis TaxID=299421 RepID=A0A8T4IR63_9ACTN|nr:hypothetical protein [Streptomyces daliensis]